jgi:hypothetical protein
VSGPHVGWRSGRDAYVSDLADLIAASPSSFHAVAEVARRLDAAGFERLDEAEAWPTGAAGARRYVVRDGSVAAWVVPAGAGPTTPYRVVGAHTDSPGFALKPRPCTAAHGWLQAGVEVYGGPLLNSWLDRELELAGRNYAGRRKLAAGTTAESMAARSDASGRTLQPTTSWTATAARLGTLPFRAVQRAFPGVGPGLVARGRKPAA